MGRREGRLRGRTIERSPDWSSRRHCRVRDLSGLRRVTTRAVDDSLGEAARLKPVPSFLSLARFAAIAATTPPEADLFSPSLDELEDSASDTSSIGVAESRLSEAEFAKEENKEDRSFAGLIGRFGFAAMEGDTGCWIPVVAVSRDGCGRVEGRGEGLAGEEELGRIVRIIGAEVEATGDGRACAVVAVISVLERDLSGDDRRRARGGM